MYGGHETDAKGNLINPSNAFDANAYVAAKLYQLQTSGTEEEKAEWAGKTAADVVAAIAENGMSPVSHYEMVRRKPMQEMSRWCRRFPSPSAWKTIRRVPK